MMTIQQTTMKVGKNDTKFSQMTRTNREIYDFLPLILNDTEKISMNGKDDTHKSEA